MDKRFEKFVIEDSELGVNDYNLGVCRGKLIYNEKEDIEEVLDNFPEWNSEIKNGIKEGYVDALENAVNDSLSNLKKLIPVYRKTKSVDVYKQIVDAYRILDNEDFEIINEQSADGTTGSATVVKKFSKDDLDAAKEYLDSDENLEIKMEDENNVYIGEKEDYR